MLESGGGRVTEHKNKFVSMSLGRNQFKRAG